MKSGGEVWAIRQKGQPNLSHFSNSLMSQAREAGHSVFNPLPENSDIRQDATFLTFKVSLSFLEANPRELGWIERNPSCTPPSTSMLILSSLPLSSLSQLTSWL